MNKFLSGKMKLMLKPRKQDNILKIFNKFPIYNDYSKYIYKIERSFCNSKNQKLLITDDKLNTENFSSEDFGELRIDGNYIDKSMLIQDFMRKKNVLITRPRRWGKTSGLSTLKRFFQAEINKQNLPDFENNESKVLFTGGEFKNTYLFPLKISNIGKKTKEGKIEKGYYIKNFQGKYPVIFVSFKRISDQDCILSTMSLVISTAFKEHEYLKNYLITEKKNFTDPVETDETIKTLRKFILGENSLTIADIQKSLLFLSELLKKHYNKRVILLIDEYDAPINSSVGKDRFTKVVELMRSIINNVAKSSNYKNVERCMFTGVTRIAKADIFSGLNNFSSYTVLDDEFAHHFGFTGDEVEDLIDKYLQNTMYDNVRESFKNSVKHWYDGYNIGNEFVYNKTWEKFHKRMYNPWSISKMIEKIQSE